MPNQSQKRLSKSIKQDQVHHRAKGNKSWRVCVCVCVKMIMHSQHTNRQGVTRVAVANCDKAIGNHFFLFHH